MDYDVIIVGAGPAGSVCATYLSESGLKILLLDKAKFPREKVCGDGLIGKSVFILKELGLTKSLESSDGGRVIRGGLFSAPSGTTVIARSSKAKNFGYTCKREVLDNILFNNAKKHVDAIQEFEVTEVLREGESVVGIRGIDRRKKSQEFKSRVVIGADGATSLVANRLKARKFADEHHSIALRAYYKGVNGLSDNIEVYFTKSLMPGYLWIFPLSNGYANVGIGMLTSDLKSRRINLKKAMQNELVTNPTLSSRFGGAKCVSEIKGWNLPLGSGMGLMGGKGWLLIGDAASLIDPLSGEGVGNAMISARLAAGYVSSNLSTDNQEIPDLSGFRDLVKKTLGREFFISRAIQKLGNYQISFDLTIGLLSKVGIARDIFADMIFNTDLENYHPDSI